MYPKILVLCGSKHGQAASAHSENFPEIVVEMFNI
jgi:hypothetical protein